MRKLFWLILFAVSFAHAQSAVTQWCDHQPFSARHCFSLMSPSTWTANFQATLPSSNSFGSLMQTGSGSWLWGGYGPGGTTGTITYSGGVFSGMASSNGGLISQTGSTSGSTGGYLDLSLLSYPPTSGACTDIWSNNVTLPAAMAHHTGGFAAMDGVFWNGPSPLYGASPSNCGPSPFISWDGSSGFQQVQNGISLNEYIGSLAGIASFSSAYNSIHSLSGGIVAGTSLVSGQPWFMQGYTSAASMLTPSYGFGYYLTSAAYVSGGTVTGSAGQYCAVGPFNGGTFQAGAQGLVTLTGTNSIAGATIDFKNPTSGALQGGMYYASAPTNGVLNNGSNVVWPGHTPASCSGTATITASIADIYFGGLGYKSGSTYWYWNNTTASWNTVDLAASYWTLTGANLYPTNTSYNMLIGEISTVTGSKLEVNGSVTALGVVQSYVAYPTAQSAIAFQTAYSTTTGCGSLNCFQVDYLGNVSMGGTLHITPPVNTLDMGFNVGQTAAGTAGSPVIGLNQIVVTDGANNGIGTQKGQALRVYSTYGGNSMTGYRNNIESDIYMATPPSTSDTDPAYVAILGTVQVVANMGGTSSVPRASYFGGSDFVILGPSATYINGVVGREIDWGGLTGSSMAINTGLSMVSIGPVHGSAVDSSINFGSGSPGFAPNYLMYLGDFHSGAAVGTNTTILGTDGNGHTAKSGIDFGAYNFTDYAFHSAHFYVDGVGNVTQSVPVTGNAVRTEWFGVNSNLVIGTESSAGGALLTGSTAYAAVINETDNVPIQFGSNGTLAASLSASTLTMHGPGGITSFTGTTPLGILVRGSTSNADYSGVDFNAYSVASGAVPVGRIGVIAGNTGSSMSFGVSANYSLGVTLAAMTLDWLGDATAPGYADFTGGYHVAGSTSINTSNQFVGAAVNVTGVVQSYAAYPTALATVAFQAAYLPSSGPVQTPFQVDYNGNVSGAGYANMIGGYKANGVQIISGAGAVTAASCVGCVPKNYTSTGNSTNTVYQNTHSYAVHEMVTFQFPSSGGYVYTNIGPTSAVSLSVGLESGNVNDNRTVQFDVPPGYYYELSTSGGASAYTWYEFY